MKSDKQITDYTLKEIVIVILSLFLILPACMETTSPSNDNERELTVMVYSAMAGIAGSTTPVRSAKVRVFLSDNGAINSLQAYTNSQGAAIFRLKVPLVGNNYNIITTYNNSTQSKNSTLICSDTTLIFIFDSTQVAELTCDELNRNETLVFVDDNGNDELKLNTPANVRRYDRCAAGLYNAGNEDITLTVPAVHNPFRLESILIDGSPAIIVNNKVTIKPGETLTLCFSVSTTETGKFTEELSIPLLCSEGQEGIYNLLLVAVVVPPTCDCDEFGSSYNLVLSNRVEVGNKKTTKKVVYTNNAPCDVVINRISFNGNSGWRIISPNFPVTVSTGKSLEITAEFMAISSGTHRDTLSLEIRPEGTDNICPFDIYLEGEGCTTSCPFISLDGVNFEMYGTTHAIDTISDRTDKRVFFSISNAEPPINTTITRLYYFMNPDSACEEIRLNVSLSYQKDDIYSPEYFTVSPQQLSLAPGEVGVIQVTFVSPDIEELDKIVATRGNTGQTADSAFNVFLRINSLGCEQKINATTVVTVFPDISPIINLRAYSQRTRLAPEPENEVYYFGEDARTILKGRGNTPGPYPPPRGHIWIDVDDTLASATPPQEPILKSVSSTLGIKIWKINMLESDFTNVGTTYLAFVGDPNYSTGYSTAPLTGLTPGNVIAFQINPYMYALIYIRSVYDGTENNTNLQSGIEFRSIYPIYIP
jgi:hypothetical protein